MAVTALKASKLNSNVADFVRRRILTDFVPFLTDFVPFLTDFVPFLTDFVPFLTDFVTDY